MTEVEFFDAIAVIHIYHRADVCYLKQALAAIQRLRNEDTPMSAAIAVDPDDQEALDSAEVAEAATDLYHEKFEEIVRERLPEAPSGYDRWGAKCFRLEGRVILDGDTEGFYPFYADHASLIKRLDTLMECST